MDQNAKVIHKDLSEIRQVLSNLHGGLSTAQFGELLTIVANYLQKPQGEKGEPGDDGKTPEKGIDYWTEEDIRVLIAKMSEVIHTPKKGEDYLTEEEIDDLVSSLIVKFKEQYSQPERGVDYMNEEDKMWIEDLLREMTKANQDGSQGPFIMGVGTKKLTVSNTAPESPEEGDLWVDTR